MAGAGHVSVMLAPPASLMASDGTLSSITGAKLTLTAEMLAKGAFAEDLRSAMRTAAEELES